MSLIIRCALKAGHSGDHIFINSASPSILGDCQARIEHESRSPDGDGQSEVGRTGERAAAAAVDHKQPQNADYGTMRPTVQSDQQTADVSLDAAGKPQTVSAGGRATEQEEPQLRRPRPQLAGSEPADSHQPTSRVSEHAALYIDSALIATVAEAILRAVCATKGERAQALAEIPPVDRVKLERTATAAVRGLNQVVDDAGVWRAAQVLGYMRHRKDWDALIPAEQLACRLEASACISAYTQHLQGTNPDYVERRTARIRAEAIARRDARRLAQGRGTAEEFSQSIQDLGRELMREQARVIAFSRDDGDANPREKNEDDGIEYGDPSDARAERLR